LFRKRSDELLPPILNDTVIFLQEKNEIGRKILQNGN